MVTGRILLQPFLSMEDRMMKLVVTGAIILAFFIALRWSGVIGG